MYAVFKQSGFYDFMNDNKIWKMPYLQNLQKYRAVQTVGTVLIFVNKRYLAIAQILYFVLFFFVP